MQWAGSKGSAYFIERDMMLWNPIAALRFNKVDWAAAAMTARLMRHWDRQFARERVSKRLAVVGLSWDEWQIDQLIAYEKSTGQKIVLD